MKELIYSFLILLLVLLFACGENAQQNNVNYKTYHNIPIFLFHKVKGVDKMDKNSFRKTKKLNC